MSLSRQSRRIPALFLVLLLAAGSGCSTDDPVPVCESCEFWSEITPGLARFPDVNPADPRWITYSTIEKRTNAPDADRESDEDIWLTYVETAGDVADSPKWQLTDDAIGLGDNTAPRFSPDGTQIAFIHSTGGGNFEVWRLPLSYPGNPGDPPLTGVAERVVANGRDPVWATDTRLYFVRGDKVYRVDLPVGPGPPVSAPLQLTFDPPTFASNATYTDRHPMFSPDGGAVFTSLDRRATADVVMKAFEIDETVFPPDTTEARAWISFQPPGAQAPQYPLFIGADTLRTPRILRSVPVDRGGIFTLGTRRDSRFLGSPALESYCDTLITIPADLQPGDVDTLKYYFKVVRGTLRIVSGIGQVNASWVRRDQREGATGTISSPGGSLSYPCLLPFRIQAGQIDVGQKETFLVRATRGPLTDSTEVVLGSGQTTTVSLFPTGRVSGTLVFPGAPPPLPQVQVSAVLSGTTFFLSSATSNATTGGFTVGTLPAATFDIRVGAGAVGYRDTTITGVVVAPPATTNIGTIVLTPGPTPGASLVHASGEASSPATEPEHVIVDGKSAAVRDNPADLASLFRAEGDLSTVWRLEEDPAGRPRLDVTELLGSEFLVQHPAVSDDLGNGLRYVAFVSNETGDWQLYVQRLQDWVVDGEPVQVLTPGSSDNLSCTRTVFHPRWVPGRGPGNLALTVALGDCPSNGFEGLGIDDNPWAVGELRIWQVELGPGF